MALGAVAIRWVLDRPQVGATIGGATRARHLAATIAAASLVLDGDDRAAIEGAIGPRRGPDGDVYALERVKERRDGAD